MKAITVEQLMKLCQMEIAKGNGKKKILLSDDDEGNGFHECFFTFTDPHNLTIDAYLLPHGVTEENVYEYLILG